MYLCVGEVCAVGDSRAPVYHPGKGAKFNLWPLYATMFQCQLGMDTNSEKYIIYCL